MKKDRLASGLSSLERLSLQSTLLPNILIATQLSAGRIPARMVGIGVRPEHVESAPVAA